MAPVMPTSLWTLHIVSIHFPDKQPSVVLSKFSEIIVSIVKERLELWPDSIRCYISTTEGISRTIREISVKQELEWLIPKIDKNGLLNMLLSLI